MRDVNDCRVPADDAHSPIPCPVQRTERVLCGGMVDESAEDPARKDERRPRQNGEIIARTEIVVFDVQKDGIDVLFCACCILRGKIPHHVPIAALMGKAGKSAEKQPAKEDEPHKPRKIAERLPCKVCLFALAQNGAHADRRLVENGVQKYARGEHMDDAEAYLCAGQNQLIEHGGDGGNAARDDRQRNKATEIAARKRTADPADDEKRGDDDQSDVVAESAVPVLYCDGRKFGKEACAEHLIGGGQNVPETVHTMVEHHQQNAQPAHEVQFPKAVLFPAAISRHRLFVSGAARMFCIGKITHRLFSVYHQTRRLSIKRRNLHGESPCVAFIFQKFHTEEFPVRQGMGRQTAWFCTAHCRACRADKRR